MSEDEQQQHDDASRARERRTRLARIFGDVLPESTGDDAPDGAEGHGGVGGRPDEWFTSERPPHHF